MSVTVIIPTTGAVELEQAVSSVLTQTYPTHCYLVCDGAEYVSPKGIEKVLEKYANNKYFHFCCLPINVGANGFYGHRIYAAFSHLIQTKYLAYLDQDNWFEPNHIQDCINSLEHHNADWGYALRNIVLSDGRFVCRDDCQSLGAWQNFYGENMVDTNAYFLKTEIAIRVASNWHGGWGQDRHFFNILSQYFPNHICTHKYSVNYRLSGRVNTPEPAFFLNGNQLMRDKYSGKLPWLLSK
ncbi:hypothetical protein CEP49_00975 [Mergibacter septicus]|uniref:glycosyltransferase family 2 protein n=1 Tax=Mergibacter septicus TaxID=221402 RepID=UPI0011792E41|nr:glycosyltransferase family A protein [Mergibacter septicus]AWX13217.1 hypothetical protein CEP49_00975 [Mergibacter septicus]